MLRELINWIIRELNPTAVVVEDDEIDSGGSEMIQKFEKSAK